MHFISSEDRANFTGDLVGPSVRTDSCGIFDGPIFFGALKAVVTSVTKGKPKSFENPAPNNSPVFTIWKRAASLQ